MNKWIATLLRLTTMIYNITFSRDFCLLVGNSFFCLFVCFVLFCFVWLFAISWAAPAAYEGSQARGRIGAVATGLHQSHSKIVIFLYLFFSMYCVSLSEPVFRPSICWLKKKGVPWRRKHPVALQQVSKVMSLPVLPQRKL